MNKGDILFYSAANKVYSDSPAGVWSRAIDQAIMRKTNSPIVHCEIMWDNDMSIGALDTGVGLHVAVMPYAIASTSSSLPTLDAASKWLLSMLGTVYGYGDVLNQFLQYLPGSPSLAIDRSADCSDLVVRFLTYGGYALPPDISLNPQDATPAQLYAILHPDNL